MYTVRLNPSAAATLIPLSTATAAAIIKQHRVVQAVVAGVLVHQLRPLVNLHAAVAWLSSRQMG
jgi:hypothetical protein